MSVLVIALVIIIVGVGLYLANRFIPMDAKIKTILNWTVCILLVVWLLRVSGLWSAMLSARV